jgi:hypothetical protein
VTKAAGDVPAGVALVAIDSDVVRRQATAIDGTAIVRSIDVLTAALAEIREGDEPAMTIEVALLRCARPDVDPSQQALAERLDRLERSMGAGAALKVVGEVKAAGAAEPPGGGGGPEPEPDAEPEARGPAAVAEGVAQAAATVAQAVDLERVSELWPAVVDQVRQSGSALLSSIYEVARPVGIDEDGSELRIGFPPSAAFNKRKAESQANRERFADALRTVVGESLRPVFVLLDSTPDGGSEELDEEELIERIKSSFGAEEIIEEEREETA